MADTNLKSETNNGILDVFSDAAEQDMEQFVDENDEMFDLLGMSEEEKQKAATQLAAEDETYESQTDSQPQSTQESESFSEEERLNNLLDDIFDEGKTADGDSTADTSESKPDAPAQRSEETQEFDMQASQSVDESLDMSALSDLAADAAQSMQEAEESLAEASSAADLTNVASAVDTAIGEEAADVSDAGGDVESDDGSSTDYEGEFDGIEISEDILDGIDLNEDLTNLEQDSTVDDLVEDTKLSKREQKKREKQALKELKKAEKEQRRAEKKAGKQGGDMPQTDAGNVVEESLDAETNDMLDSLSEQLDADDGAALEGAMSVEEAQTESMSFLQKASLVLFGPDEEEDEGPTEEEIAAKQAKKEAKAAKKEEKKKQKEEKAGEKAVKKQQAQEMAVVKKAAAKDKKEKIRQEEEEEDAKEKRINPKTVVTVSGILLILLITVVFGTNQFNYRMVITRAVNYFEMQKYKMAYEQIVGVDVKDRDRQIKDKIYCVMYVQQQIDSYNNFCKLEMYENALDSLVKGVSKYDAHIEEARELGIESDLDGLRVVIEKDLQEDFGLSMDTVEQWIQMDQVEYSKQLQEYVASVQFTEE